MPYLPETIPGNYGLQTADLTEQEHSDLIGYIDQLIHHSQMEMELLGDRGPMITKAAMRARMMKRDHPPLTPAVLQQIAREIVSSAPPEVEADLHPKPKPKSKPNPHRATYEHDAGDTPAPKKADAVEKDEEEGSWWEKNKAWVISLSLIVVGAVALVFVVKAKQKKKKAEELDASPSESDAEETES